jgi:hypothetical protein
MADNKIIARRKKMANETLWILPLCQIWYKNVFQYARLTKRQGHVLMTKFGESKKTRLSDFLFWTIWFRQFQDKTKEPNLKI